MDNLQLQRPFRLPKSQGTGYPAQKKVGMPPQAFSGHLPARVSRCASDIGSQGVNTTACWQPRATVNPRQPPLLRPPLLGQACQTATAGREARSPKSQGPGPRTPALLNSAATTTKLRLGHYRSSRGGPRKRRKQPGRAPGDPEEAERGAGPYLSHRDPPLRVTRHAVHCGAGSGLPAGMPASNVAGAGGARSGQSGAVGSIQRPAPFRGPPYPRLLQRRLTGFPAPASGDCLVS